MRIPIKSYEGMYEIDTEGNVWSLSGKKLKPSKGNNGYLVVNLYKDKKPKQYYIHRLLGISFLDNPKNNPQIAHLDGNRSNNTLNNIIWVTQQENEQHKILHGTMVRGEKVGSAKLKEEDIKTIRCLHKKGEGGYRKLAKQFHVSRETIRGILQFKTWKHI